ncbi:peptidase C39 [Clostridia bacterium]|nr:peptidase C39 [Clostridia bacterium]
MKTPLHYQITEYDCGPTSVLNAMRFLFERENIPPEVQKYVTMYCLDAYNSKGEHGKNGTSKMAMMFLANWLNQFEKTQKFPIFCRYLSGNEASVRANTEVVGALQQGGAVMVRLMYGVWHYVLLTGLDGEWVEVFDPYYREKPFRQKSIQIVNDSPLSMNRRVRIELFEGTGKTTYALGNPDEREAVLFFNTRTRKTPDKTIEYFL